MYSCFTWNMWYICLRFFALIVTQMMLHIPLQMIKVKMVPLKELYE